MKTLIVLGADRVGKTSLIKSWKEEAGIDLKIWSALHFKGILPSDHSPIDQFLNPLRDVFTEGSDYLFCDRFVHDTIFYEAYRKQMGEFDPEFIRIVDSAYRACSDGVLYTLLLPSGKNDMRKRHSEELINKYPGASKWWVQRNVDLRMAEQDRYYEHLDKYVNEYEMYLTNGPCTIEERLEWG